MKDVLVIDDFLPEHQFKMLRDIMMSYYFPWCYWWGRDEDEPKDFFFHTFYRDEEDHPSEYFSMLKPTLQKLVGDRKLMRVKSVLTTQTVDHHNSGYHYDYDDMTTAIYYINTCNGWTEFEEGGKVKSVANRVIVFDSNLIHGGVSCTDEKTRILINFNYER